MTINKFLLISWFIVLFCVCLCFLVSKIRTFEVPTFQSFKNHLILREGIDPTLPKNISCFLGDIDLIFKILKNSLDGSSGLFAMPLSFQTLRQWLTCGARPFPTTASGNLFRQRFQQSFLQNYFYSHKVSRDLSQNKHMGASTL